MPRSLSVATRDLPFSSRSPSALSKWPFDSAMGHAAVLKDRRAKRRNRSTQAKICYFTFAIFTILAFACARVVAGNRRPPYALPLRVKTASKTRGSR